ncbi:unnamed protein product [Adineta ricciae]|uniref:Uncharacterized protein n=2 Tax=Adineta ricciae TaxID=249248 RepID=A0A815HCB4_ADIRI|nr:unnamed protein product [Adineta ricciae]
MIHAFILLLTCMMCYSRYLFYHTSNEQAFDCLYAHIQHSLEMKTGGAYLILYHIIPFCQRLNENRESVSISDENIQNKISFKELYRNGITSSQLLDWFAPIDIAEEYESNGRTSDEFFYNCSLPWFGTRCQYRLINNQPIPFGILFRRTFIRRDSPSLTINFSVGACYLFLNTCIRGPSPMCLDWREICNGVYDCVNGEDEQFCYLLEQNQCSSDEFQCLRSKECISQTFVEDFEHSFECLDTSDENGKSPGEFGELCISFATFECEEVAHGFRNQFSCGDGEIQSAIFPRFYTFCQSLRDQHMTKTLFTSFDYISNLACRQLLICFIRPDRITDLSYLYSETQCELSSERCSLDWLVFPEYPILYSFFQFVYFTNRSISLSNDDLTPDLICFNTTRCPKYLFCSVDIGMQNGLHCCHTRNIIRRGISAWFSLQTIFLNTFSDCFPIARNEKYISSNRETQSSLSVDNRWINLHQTFAFARLCDDHRDIRDNTETNDTDESDCHFWPCNNPYTRCNRYLHCLNGIDEVNCPHKLCSFNELTCDDYSSHAIYCLPISLLADDHARFNPRGYPSRVLYLVNETAGNVENYLAWNQSKCLDVDYFNRSELVLVGNNDDTCLVPGHLSQSGHEVSFVRNNTKMCRLTTVAGHNIQQHPFTQSLRLGYFPPIIPQASPQSTEIQSNEQIPVDLKSDDFIRWYCNRGFLILYQNNQTVKCLCPPSYFGPRCQWQNQRVSLSLQLKHFSFTYQMPIFQVIIMLIDDQGQITPYHEQTIHEPKRDCGTRYHMYLLYPSQPKNSSIDYAVRIDIFNRITLTHWASWLLPITFPFLPVNRVARELLIPPNPQRTDVSCPLPCGKHGKCLKYVNKNASYFCQCDSGYSGFNCQFKHNSSCSSDSFSRSSSICVCPLYQFGPKCYLKHTACQTSTNPCRNDALCIPIDDRVAQNSFTCVCKENFFGDRCENIQNRIDIEFNDHLKTTTVPIWIHLITIYNTSKHIQSTILKQIKYGQNEVTIRTTTPFHLVFVAYFHEEFYLIIRREQFIKSEHIQAKVLPDYQCLFVNELLNETLASFHYLRRIKYYPLLCRQKRQVMCFYDEIYMCVCDQDRFSNCFSFNRTTADNCNQRENPCENNGKCFIANQTCSSSIKCLCSGCFYGTKCQFTTEGFVLSLDYILSYHIKPNLSFSQQPFIVKMSASIIVVMFLIGFIGGLLSIVTFRVRKTRTTGCGFYLLVSGWTSIVIVSVLVLKFIQLLLLQMKIHNNLSIFRLNCILLDVLIKILLAINDWLDGCVSIERVITVMQGVKFNKTKSRQVSKWVTLIISFIIILTHLHDPFHRQLIEDIDFDEERTWCIVQYSTSLNIYNSFITLFHFLTPFTINFLSTIIIIIKIARNRSTIQSGLSYSEHLKLQLIQYKHQFMASLILVLLGLPRLVISFINGCMKSPHHSWLFLTGYLVSFLPSMMTFVIYVLPSKMFKDEFDQVVRQTIRRFRN